MNEYDLKIGLVLNKEYKFVSGNSLIKNVPQSNVKDYVRDKIKTPILMNKYARRLYKVDQTFKSNICGDCANMLICPKVRDREKRALKAYPFIIDGIEISLCDKKVQKVYLEALEKYNELKKDEHFFLDDYPELKLDLCNEGKEVVHMTVFECKNFISDEEKEAKEKAEKQMIIKHPYKRRF